MPDNTCMLCGRIIPEGRHICLSCEGQNEMQRFVTDKPKPKTNGDRIRQMTDEELIPIVLHWVCHNYYQGVRNCGAAHCDDCVRAWLRREAGHD